MADITIALRQQRQHLLLHPDTDDEDDDLRFDPQSHANVAVAVAATEDGVVADQAVSQDTKTRVPQHQQLPNNSNNKFRTKKSSQFLSPKLYDFSLITTTTSPPTTSRNELVETTMNSSMPSPRHSQQQQLSLVSILEPTLSQTSSKKIVTTEVASALHHSDVTSSPLQQPPSVSTNATTTTTNTTGTSTSSTCSGGSTSPHQSRRPLLLQPHETEVPFPSPPPPPPLPTVSSSTPPTTSFLSASLLRRQKRRMIMNTNNANDTSIGVTRTRSTNDADETREETGATGSVIKLEHSSMNDVDTNDLVDAIDYSKNNTTSIKNQIPSMSPQSINVETDVVKTSSSTFQELPEGRQRDETLYDGATSSTNKLLWNMDAQLASEYFQNEQYNDALQAYERATQSYCQQLHTFLIERSSNIDLLQQLFPSYVSEGTTISSPQRRSISEMNSNATKADSNRVKMVTVINAAGCYRNMGAIARILHQSPSIIDHYLHCAQYLYQLVQEWIEQEEAITWTDSETLAKSDNNEIICIPQMIFETMQSRAVNYLQFDNDVSLAISCHEECISQMLLCSVPTSRTKTATSLVDGIILKSLSTLKWLELMTYSLHHLGNIYRTVIPNSIVTLQAHQESIHAVKGKIPWDDFETIYHNHTHNGDKQSTHDDDSAIKSYRYVIETVIEILRNLSEIYTEYCSRQSDDDETHNIAMDCAIDTLHDAMDVELQYNYVCHVEPNAEALQAIDQMGLANEQLQQYDKALVCYEKALLARSQYYGEHHIDVAKSLINVARIMEAQGNVEGGLDLYRAAHAIYTYQITSTQPTIFANGDDASAILQLIPNLLEKERYEEARAYLTKCLTIVEKEEQASDPISEKKLKDKTVVDKSQIYYDLGRACIGLKDNVSATIYLVESAKVENGKVTEEQVLTLLQHIESIQRRDERNGSTRNATTLSDDIQHQLLHKIYSLDESIRLSRSLDDQLNLTLSNLVSVPSRESSKSVPTTSFRTLSPSTSCRKRTSKASGKIHPRSTTFSTASSRDLDYEHDPIERPESVLSGLTSILQSESSHYSNSKNVNDTKENCPESDLSGMTSLFKDDSRSRNFNSRPTLSTNTIPTMDLISDVEPNFRAELFDPCHNNNISINRHRQRASDVRGLTDEEMTIQLIEHTHISTMSGSITSPTRPVESKSGSKRSPSQHVFNNSVLLSDDVELRIPISFDTSCDRSKESSWNKLTTGRGLMPRSAPTTPRKIKDEKSTSSSQQQQKPMLTKMFGEKLRRRPRREGFQTLSDSPPTQRKTVRVNESELPTEEEITEEGSAVTGTVPVFLVGGVMDDDDLSDITMRHFNDLNSSPRDAGQEWWWGVTAEGFGRWFPTAYVTQAVQAADAFLSAKAIHAQSPKCSNQKDLSVNSTAIGSHSATPVSPTKIDNNAIEENSQSEGSSQDQQDIASNVGITSTKASRVNFLDYTSDRGYQAHEGAQKSLRSQSFPLNLFTSPAPSQRLDYDNGKDIVSEILACRELLMTQQKQFGVYDNAVANTLFKLAILYSRDRDIEAAIECANEALRIQLKMDRIPEGAQSLHFLADLYLHQKEYKHALTHYERALSYETKFFGYISDSVAKTLNCIGMVRLLQNDFRSSMESHQQALCILQECHDDDENDGKRKCSTHPFVAEVLCHIGNVFYRERHQDSNSVAPSTATASSSSRSSEKYMTHLDSTMFERLGRAYEDRGLYSMAIYFLKEKSHYLESAKVEQTLDVLNESAGIYSRLGLLSCCIGSYDVAIQYFERALSLQLQLGCTAVQVAISRVYIASAQYHLGQYNSALLSYHDALECYHNINEIEDSDKDILQECIALTLYYMGIAQAALCDFNTAMITLKDAHTIQQDHFGVDHPYTLRTRREIGSLNTLYVEDVPIALKYFQSVITAQKRYHNVDRHPNIAETLHSIGLAYIRQKDYNRALRTLEECYYMRLQFFGSDHPIQATTLYDIAKVYLLLQRHSYQKVLQICDHVLHIRLLKLQEKHIDIARVYIMKGTCYVGIGNSDDAYTCFADAYKMATECLKNDEDSNNVNENHTIFAEIYTEWSVLHLMKCQFDMARSFIGKAIAIYKTKLQMDDDYDGINAAQQILHRIEHDEMLCV